MIYTLTLNPSLDYIVTVPNFIFIFTCPKTLYLCGFSPFSIFLLHPFYTLFSTVGVAASNC